MSCGAKPEFEKASSFEAALVPGEDVDTGRAKAGFDRVISDDGLREADDVDLDGLARVAGTIFSNKTALVDQPGDPAGIRVPEDAARYFRRIAATKSGSRRTTSRGVRDLTQDRLERGRRAGNRAGLVLDEGHRKERAQSRRAPADGR